MLYRTEHVKLHTLIHITTTSFHTLIHITSTSLTIESCIPRNFKLHPDPHNHKYWDLQIDRSVSTKASYSWIPQNMLFNMGRSPQRSSSYQQHKFHSPTRTEWNIKYLHSSRRLQPTYICRRTSGKLMEQNQTTDKSSKQTIWKKCTTRFEHEHRKENMISVKLKLSMKAE